MGHKIQKQKEKLFPKIAYDPIFVLIFLLKTVNRCQI